MSLLMPSMPQNTPFYRIAGRLRKSHTSGTSSQRGVMVEASRTSASFCGFVRQFDFKAHFLALGDQLVLGRYLLHRQEE